MRKILINVLDGQFNDHQMKQLEVIVRRLYAEYVSNAHTIVVWMENPPEHVYTNYQLSNMSFITMMCEAGYEQAKREALLKTLCVEWCDITGQDTTEVLISLFEPALFNAVLNGMRNRFSLTEKARFMADLLRSIVLSKKRRGLAVFNPNR